MSYQLPRGQGKGAGTLADGGSSVSLLEQRLAECKVMIVLIGPDWLNSRDEQGRRRLDSSDDWVRLEIAHALKRDITVIPVLVNGAALPERTALPDDIRGLLDHQAVSVTNAGFRHEMSGQSFTVLILVRRVLMLWDVMRADNRSNV